MTQKERLVNLLLPQLFMFSAVDCGKLADHLLDNGVIVPPCKVGDVLYVITTICGTSIDEVTVFSFTTMKHYVTINTIHKSNPLSPLFANLLLSEFDHTVKEKFRFKGYFRYLDDIVVIETGENAKDRLKELSAYAHEYFAGIGLDIKPNEQIFPIERNGIDFLGYIFGRKKMRLRKKTERRFRRAVHRFHKHKTERNRATLSSYWGMLKRMPRGLRLWFTFFSVPIKKLKLEVSV